MTTASIATDRLIAQASNALQAEGPLKQALIDFDLMAAFLARPAWQQRSFARIVAAAFDKQDRQERIAELLDELSADIAAGY